MNALDAAYWAILMSSPFLQGFQIGMQSQGVTPPQALKKAIGVARIATLGAAPLKVIRAQQLYQQLKDTDEYAKHQAILEGLKPAADIPAVFAHPAIGIPLIIAPRAVQYALKKRSQKKKKRGNHTKTAAQTQRKTKKKKTELYPEILPAATGVLAHMKALSAGAAKKGLEDVLQSDAVSRLKNILKDRPELYNKIKDVTLNRTALSDAINKLKRSQALWYGLALSSLIAAGVTGFGAAKKSYREKKSKSAKEALTKHLLAPGILAGLLMADPLLRKLHAVKRIQNIDKVLSSLRGK